VSVAVAVGFMALAGVAAEIGVVMLIDSATPKELQARMQSRRERLGRTRPETTPE
jgi:Cu/Ag efflux pump CusA